MSDLPPTLHVMNETEDPTLHQEHYDLLRAVLDLQGDDDNRYPTTTDVGLRLLELFKAHPPYSWTAYSPWQGTDPYAKQLERGGLLDIHYGIAKFRHPNEPIAPVQHYYLGITSEGRRILAANGS